MPAKQSPLSREQVATLCDEHMMEWQVARRYYIRHRTRISNALGGLVRRRLGWTWDTTEKVRASINRRTDRIVDAALKGKAFHADDLEYATSILDHLQAAQKMYQVADEALDRITKEMTAAAKLLPVYAFVESVRGAGPTTLAVIVGEAGDLCRYPHPDKLKKRLGLAPFTKDGITQAPSTWAKRGGLTAADWADPEHGPKYAPKRLGEIFGSVTVPLCTKQLVGKAKTGDGPRQAHGKYGEVYLRRVARTLETKPELTPQWRHLDACRVMTSAFVSDLWSEWQRAVNGVPNRATLLLPAANYSEAIP